MPNRIVQISKYQNYFQNLSKSAGVNQIFVIHLGHFYEESIKLARDLNKLIIFKLT